MFNVNSFKKIYPIDSAEFYFLENLVLKTVVCPGICPICGNITLFKWGSSNFRESGRCLFCKNTNRKRQVANILLDAFSKISQVKFPSIYKLSKILTENQKLNNIVVYNTETYGSLHEYLHNFPGYISSEYFGEEFQSGDIVNGKLHQDLTKTSFQDNSIDILISSDCFEHIPQPYKAFKEIFRILKSGGRHIFTVPFYQDQYFDEVRAYIDENGELQNNLPPIYHSDPLREEGILVYVIFSLEMLLKLKEIGYEVNMYNLRNPWLGILGNNALVFETIKPF